MVINNDKSDHDSQDKTINDFILLIRSNPLSPEYYLLLANCYSLIGKDWEASIHYRAFLDFTGRGKKAREVKKKLKQMQVDPKTFDAKGWLLESENKYLDYVEQMGSTGKKLGQKITTTTDKAVKKDEIIDGLQSWLKDVAPHKAQEWARAHFENALNLANNSKIRASVAQLITGIEIYPHDHPARCMLARLFAIVGERHQALDILNLVDTEECEPIVKQILIDEVNLVKSMINS
jgi:hypothetical protein